MSLISTLDYLAWIIQAMVTLVLAFDLLKRMKQVQLDGQIWYRLVWLIVLESLATLIFEFMFWLIVDKSSIVIITYSVAIGAEVAFKQISLWLFGLTYLKSSLEMP